ncbi:hypothetical protein S40285_02535 [Stachybotrys chlorohalonatus IBT 40285]|uniref:Alpha-1,3-mannosyltransferase CMT1 n=1 Tax=Stachybotrys chlorohalonatus (strain IBT 40285) TaxID=1283841 RepID=A0A084QWL2_STAC4|nr:hypothetical protein S40285_02535 [Stachybotrys chlorohalonata IBT 40285]
MAMDWCLHRRKLRWLLLSISCILLVLTSTRLLAPEYLEPVQSTGLLRPVLEEDVPPSEPLATTADAKQSTSILTSSTLVRTATPTPTPYIVVQPDGAILPASRITPYLSAILDPAVTEPPRLQCPSLNVSRYQALLQRPEVGSGGIDKLPVDFYFALDLRDCVSLLPRLLGSIVEAFRFLGPGRCALSIVEGNSPDGTGDVLQALAPHLQRLGITYFFSSSDIDPSAGDRIRRLADLRNLALQPLLDSPDLASSKTTVLFVNDVAPCAEDLLELLLQRQALGADMTCAMDWTHSGGNPLFYDVWIARTIHGDSFFEIPPDGSWDRAWDLFWNAPETYRRFQAHLPFQVFSCWNGAAAFTAAPVLQGLRFREPRGGEDGECGQGEPQLFCKDMWFHGYGKIAVVPSVNLEYTNELAAEIKQTKGYTLDLVRNHTDEEDRIDWVLEPPDMVKCMPMWTNQFWRPWNESLK